MELDVLEWWCHSALLRAPSHQVIQQRAEQAVVSLQRRQRCLSTTISGRGRLWNRIALLTLVQDVCARPIDGPEGLESQSPNQWIELQERLGQCRRGLLRSDANNHNVVVATTSSEEDMPPSSSSNNDDDDNDVAQLPLFQETYEDMKQLLQTHACVARFRQELQKLLSDANDDDDDDDNEQPLLQPPQDKPEKINRNRLNEILRAYEDDLGAVENVPDRDTLLACLRNDLLRRPKKDSIQELPAKFLQELHKTTCDSKDLDVSYPALQASFQQLLRYWSEAVLQVPTLVQLGYGSSSSNSSSLFRSKLSSGLNREQSNADAQSVSSWGMDEQEEAENRKMVNDKDDDDDDDPSDGYHTATEELEPSSSSPGNSVAGMRIEPRQPWQQDFAALDNLDPQSTPLVKNVSQKTTTTTTTTTTATAATSTTTATAMATTTPASSKAGKQTKKKRPKSLRKRPTAALKTVQRDGRARQGASSRVDELFMSQPSGSFEKVAFPGSAMYRQQLDDGIINNNNNSATIEELDIGNQPENEDNNNNFVNNDQSLVPTEETLDDDEELSKKRPASAEARRTRATSEEEEEEEDPPPKKRTRADYSDATALEDISLSSSHDEDEDWVIGEEEEEDDDDDSEDERILLANIPIHRQHVIEQSSDLSSDEGMSFGGKATVSESDGENWVPRSPVRVLSPGLRKSPRLKGHRRSVGTPNSTTSSIVPWPDSSSDEEEGSGLRMMMMMRERLPSLGSILSSNRSRRKKRGTL